MPPRRPSRLRPARLVLSLVLGLAAGPSGAAEPEPLPTPGAATSPAIISAGLSKKYWSCGVFRA